MLSLALMNVMEQGQAILNIVVQGGAFEALL